MSMEPISIGGAWTFTPAVHRDDRGYFLEWFRAGELAEHGLTIRSPLGDFHHPSPPVVSPEALAGPFDLVLLSCKAYDLNGAMESFARAVGDGTTILPLLNGMRHLDALADRFTRHLPFEELVDSRRIGSGVRQFIFEATHTHYDGEGKMLPTVVRFVGTVVATLPLDPPRTGTITEKVPVLREVSLPMHLAAMRRGYANFTVTQVPTAPNSNPGY